MKTLRSSSFRLDGTGRSDDAAALQRLLDAATSQPSRVVLEPGTYRLGSGRAGFAAVLDNAVEVHLEAHDATLLVTDPTLGGLLLRDCTDVAVEGLVVDFDPVPYAQGAVVAVDDVAGVVDVDFDPAYLLPDSPAFFFDHDVLHPSQFGSFYDSASRLLKEAHRDHVFAGGMERLDGNRWRVSAIDERRALHELHGIAWEDLPQGGFTALTGVVGGDLFVFAARHQGCGVQLVRSRDVTLTRTEIRAAASHAYLAERCGDVTLHQARVERPAGSDRLISTDGDGFHYKDGWGRATVMDSSFEAMLDDGVNVNATPMVVEQVDGASLVVSPRAPLHVGDHLLVQNPRTGQVRGTTTVEALAPRPDGRVAVRGATPLDELKPGRSHFDADVVVNLTWSGAGFRVVGNTFRDHRGIGVRPRAPHGLVEGNTIERTGSHAILACNDPSWPEGPIPHEITIRANAIADVGRTNLTEAIRLVGARTGDVPADPPILKGARILDNTIKDVCADGVYAGGCHSLEIDGNQIDGVGRLRPGSRALVVELCADVTGRDLATYCT